MLGNSQKEYINNWLTKKGLQINTYTWIGKTKFMLYKYVEKNNCKGHVPLDLIPYNSENEIYEHIFKNMMSDGERKEMIKVTIGDIDLLKEYA